MRRVIITFVVFLLAVRVQAETSSEAVATTKRYAEALASLDVVPMVEEMHSDFHESCYKMAVHIVETMEPKSEKDELLKGLGVSSVEALKKLTPKTATVRFCQFAFAAVPK